MTSTKNSYTKPLLFGACRKQGLCVFWVFGQWRGVESRKFVSVPNGAEIGNKMT